MRNLEHRNAGRLALLALAVCLTAAGLAPTAFAQSTAKSNEPSAAASEKSPAGPEAPAEATSPDTKPAANVAPSAGLRVVKDPETGKLRGPDRAEAAKMNGPAMNRSAEGLRPEVLPNGVTVINLQGRFQSYSVATRKPDGKIEIQCHTTEPGHSHAAQDGDAEKPEDTGSNGVSKPTVNSHGK